jgi:hypothetical protein
MKKKYHVTLGVLKNNFSFLPPMQPAHQRCETSIYCRPSKSYHLVGWATEREKCKVDYEQTFSNWGWNGEVMGTSPMPSFITPPKL